MSFGVTFGSIGDLIAVGQIAFSLAKALGSSHGSVKEYQDLIKNLQLFDKTLFQATLLLQSYQATPEIVELCVLANEVAKDSQVTLNEFRKKVERKYGSMLGTQGPVDVMAGVKAVGKKIGWVREREEVAELKTKLQAGVNSIALLISAAVGKSSILNDKKQEIKIQAIHELLRDSLQRAADHRSAIQAEQSRSMDVMLNNLNSGFATVIQVNTTLSEVKGMLERFQVITNSLHNAPAGFGGTWQQAPMILEDALGKVVPIPLELVDSWDMFHTILSKRFETQKYPGQLKVLKGEYSMDDSLTCEEISRDRIDWTAAFRPGQKVDMSIRFIEISTTETSCPKCKTVVSAPAGTRVKCINLDCNMVFRRLVQLDDAKEEDPDINFQTPWLNNAAKKGTKELEASPTDFHRVTIIILF